MRINNVGSGNGHGSWDELWRRRKRFYIYGNVVTAAENYLGGLKRRSILEVGCGRGATLVELARRGANVVGLDYSEEALAVCKALESRNGIAGRATFVKGDARKLPFPDESFDFVFSVGLIEHFRDPCAILSEQHRVLRPDGVIFLQVPQKYSVYTAVKKLLIRMGRWPYGGWETEFSEKELSELAVRAGFAPEYSYGYGSFALAAVRHVVFPTLDFAGMWRVGLNWPWVRSLKARTSLDVCLVARKLPVSIKPQMAEVAVSVLKA